LWDAIAGVGASHNSGLQFDRGRCLPGTREEVRRMIHEWRLSKSSDTPPICWLSGSAGVGKSAIALSVAKECENNGLVASFFFFRSDPNRNIPRFLILCIAHGIATSRPHLKDLIDQRIAADPKILEAALEEQYRELIVNPCTKEKRWWLRAAQKNNFIIIDGLDECSDPETQQHILSIISSTYLQPLKSPLQFLICSRPESWLQETFSSSIFCNLTKHIHLNDAFQADHDIRLYLESQFQNIQNDPKYSQVDFPKPWPAPNVIDLLVKKADGQFIYASTVMLFIK
ncbi:hypothetical protein L218DRAFT_842430, partial [Marasmius fiardii PR-910]